MSLPASRNLILCAFRSGFEAYRDAFESLGYDVQVHVVEPAPEDAARATLCLPTHSAGARRPGATWRLKRRLGPAGVPLIGLDRDAPWHMGLHVRRLRLFAWLRLLDIYATHTLQPTYDFAPVKHFNPSAVWTRHYNLHGRTLQQMRDPDFYRWDASFVGNMDGVRYREHAERQRFFAALAPRLEALGLRVLFRHSGGMGEAEQIEVIQRTIVNLSYRSSCDYRSRRGIEMSWGLPERCFGVPARGGFLLADERRHAADCFEPGREWVSYRDLEDCIAKVTYYAGHLAEARAIAEAAHARVMREHTYEHRAHGLAELAVAWRRSRGVPD